MLFVISPAKALDYTSPAPAVTATEPEFQSQAKQLIAVLDQKSPQEVAQLMSLSDKLAALNVARYAAWRAKPKADTVRPAVFAFDGDVYDGLGARGLPEKTLNWMQGHVRILSGLYGSLRPFDLLQPYRLEMGTKLATERGSDLYHFWGDRIAKNLNAVLAEQGGEPVLVNLASQEYFRSVDRKRLSARVVECVLQDEKNGEYKIISFFAKRARGLMLRWAAERQVSAPDELKGFDVDGYTWHAAASKPDRLVFRRKEKA